MTIPEPIQSQQSGQPGLVDEGPENWVEARLDLLLAQECYADLMFARWLAGKAGVVRADDVELRASHVATSVVDDDDRIPADAVGETDLQLELEWSDRSTSTVLIEDKVWAEFQPRQLERYRIRCESIGASCLLIAPSAYLSRIGDERKLVDGAVSVEDIATRIEGRGDRRSKWVAAYLRDLIAPKVRKVGVSDPATVAFTEFCIERLAGQAANVVPRRSSLHTVNQGWLYFEVPSDLIYKVTGVKADAEAFIDLYLEVDDAAVDATEPGGAGPIDGFVFDVDTVGNRLLRYRCPKLDPHFGVPVTNQDRAVLADALDACVRAAAWVRDRSQAATPVTGNH